MIYQVLTHRQAKRALKRIHPHDRKRLLKAFSRLKREPFSKKLDIRKLARTKNSFRIRVGDLRAIYEIDKKKKVIYIWEVGYRGSVY